MTLNSYQWCNLSYVLLILFRITINVIQVLLSASCAYYRNLKHKQQYISDTGHCMWPRYTELLMDSIHMPVYKHKKEQGTSGHLRTCSTKIQTCFHLIFYALKQFKSCLLQFRQEKKKKNRKKNVLWTRTVAHFHSSQLARVKFHV